MKIFTKRFSDEYLLVFTFQVRIMVNYVNYSVIM